jgi:hypothetical protein
LDKLATRYSALHIRTQGRHEPAITEFVGRFLGRSLPNPDYGSATGHGDVRSERLHWFSFEASHPIVARAIETASALGRFADRDTLVKAVLSDPVGHALVNDALSRAEPETTPWDVASKMVDWFSAHFTQGSSLVAEWVNRFERLRVTATSSSGAPTPVWAYRVRTTAMEVVMPEEIATSLREGSTTLITVNVHERNPTARRLCLEHYGYACAVCDTVLEDVYGELAREFIHVHHLTPLSAAEAARDVDPIRDLRPVCPNCHAILHRLATPLPIEQLRAMLSNLTKPGNRRKGRQ